jgi:SAM-dependent methyltransferase
LDYIKPALEAGEKLAKAQGVKVHFEQVEIDKPWPHEDNFFDFALDSYASIDIETLTGRTTCRDEMLRTLKPGGYGLVTVVAADDEQEQALIVTNPGPEPNSTLWPQNGKFQKDYDEPELRAFYKDFEIVELEKISKRAFKLGREYQAVNFRLIVRKRR